VHAIGGHGIGGRPRLELIGRAGRRLHGGAIILFIATNEGYKKT
jgi:hypothetical protein